MLSDVLSDATVSMKEYIEKYPEIYGGDLREPLNNLMEHMRLLVVYLDTNPARLPGIPNIPPPPQGAYCYWDPTLPPFSER